MKKISIFSILFLVIDIVVKLVVNNTMELFSSIKIIPNFFYITYVRNVGAAFSILEGNRILLICIGMSAIIVIYEFLIKNNNFNNFEIITYSMLLGGIIGNLLDRIIYGYVIDYFDFKIINYNFPIFNLADCFIVISIILMIIKNIQGALCKK